MHVVLALPPHEIARERKHDGIHRAPSDEDAEVYAQARMQVEQDLSAALYHVV